MSNIWNRFIRTLAIIGGVLLGLVMVIIVLDVAGRVIFNAPITGMVDIVCILIPIIVFLPMAYTESLDEHIRVEVFTNMLSRKKQQVLDVFAFICGAALFSVFGWIAWNAFWESWLLAEYYPGLYRLRVYPAKFAIALGFTLITILLIIKGIVSIRSIFSLTDSNGSEEGLNA